MIFFLKIRQSHQQCLQFCSSTRKCKGKLSLYAGWTWPQYEYIKTNITTKDLIKAGSKVLKRLINNTTFWDDVYTYIVYICIWETLVTIRNVCTILKKRIKKTSKQG